MQQEERDAATLAARKAELLSMIDDTMTQNGSSSDESVIPVEDCRQALDVNSESRTFMQESSISNGIYHNTEMDSLNTSSTIESDTRKMQSVTKDEGENGVPETMEGNAVTNKLEGSKVNFNAPFAALCYDEEFGKAKENFTKGCKWSPDGTCLLVASNDKNLRIFNLPSQVAGGNFQDENWFVHEYKRHTAPALTMKEGECIYDYTWYPAMNSNDPRTCCFAVACRDIPVHLWDAWQGKIICSYQPYDHVDQLVAPKSVSFNLDGTQLYCGFNKCIRVFQTSRPGREFTKIASKEQAGIISCFAFNPALPSIFVAGSYLGNLGIYNSDNNKMFCLIEGCPGGITQLMFSADGTKLFSGGRMSDDLLCWDLRNPGKILWTFKREVKTNQRIYFDLDPQCNNYLVSGTTNGTVVQWDLQGLASLDDADEPPLIQHTSKFVAHKDCCNGISLNPHYPILATSSGQRHFPEPQSFSDLDSSSDECETPLFNKTIKYENSVKLWWFGR